MMCSTQMMVMPSSSRILRSMSAAWSISASSRPPRLSSASRSLGPVASALASSSFLSAGRAQPVDRRLRGRSAGRPGRARVRPPRSALARAVPRPGRRSPRAPRSRRCESRRNGRGIWKVRPMPRLMMRCGGRPPISRPSKRIEPADGRERARQHVEDRALARAVGADQAEDLALIDLERHVVDGGEAAETLDQTLDDKHSRKASV